MYRYYIKNGMYIYIYDYVCVYDMGSHDAWDAPVHAGAEKRGPTSLLALECFQGSFCPERSMVPRSCRKGLWDHSF